MIHAAPAVLVKSLHDSFHALTGVAIASRLFEPKRKSPLAIFLLQSTSHTANSIHRAEAAVLIKKRHQDSNLVLQRTFRQLSVVS